MLKGLQRFIRNPKPSKQEALGVLRANFALMFLAQLVCALLLAMILRFFSKGQIASPFMSQILVLFSLLQLPIGLSLPLLAARTGGKGPALAASIFMAVLLSGPAWFLAFAFVIGSSSFYLILLLLIVISYYNIGFFFCGRFADIALLDPRPGAPMPDD